MGGTVTIRHRAYEFAKQIIFFIDKQHYTKVHYPLVDQLLRSSTSIGANLAEGYAGASKNDFIKYYIIALKSANETKYWVCLLRDTIWVEEKITLNELLKEADELSKIIASIIIKTKNNEKN